MIEVCLVGFVLALYFGTWLYDYSKEKLCERKQERDKVEHVKALAAQLCLVQEWERLNVISQSNIVNGWTGPPKKRARPGRQ